MRNSSLSRQHFVDIVSVRVTFPLLLKGQVCCIAQGFWLSISEWVISLLLAVALRA